MMHQLLWPDINEGSTLNRKPSASWCSGSFLILVGLKSQHRCDPGVERATSGFKSYQLIRIKVTLEHWWLPPVLFSFVFLFVSKGNFGDRYFGTDAPSDWCESDEGMDFWGENRGCGGSLQKHLEPPWEEPLSSSAALTCWSTSSWREAMLYKLLPVQTSRAEFTVRLVWSLIWGRIRSILHSRLQHS